MRRCEKNTAHFFRVIRIAGSGSALIAVLVFFFFSRFFTIEFINVESQGGLDQTPVRAVVFAQMDKSRFWLLGQKNIFLFSVSELKRELARKFALETILVKKQLPHTIRVQLTGKPFRLLHVRDGRVFDIASDGSVNADFTDDRDDKLTAVRFARALARGPYDPLRLIKSDNVDAPIVVDTPLPLDSTVVSFIQELFVRSRDRGYQPLFFSISPDTPTVRMKARDGWDALFSKREPPAQQVNALRAAFDNIKKKDRARLEYIDVRFGSRVFYK